MTNKPFFAVVGAGNAGLALAGQLALQGLKVNLYNRTLQKISELKKRGGINLSGVFTGFGRLNIVTDNIEEAIKDVDVIMIATPAIAHKNLASEMGPYLQENQLVILNPGRTGGAFEFKNNLVENGKDDDILIAEAQTFIYACRKIGPTDAHIFGIKNRIPLAALPGRRTKEVMEKVGSIIPQFKGVSSVLKTSMNNIGAILHPLPMLLNLGRIEDKGDFLYYHEGITPTVAKVLEIVDQERIDLAHALGIKSMRTADWMRKVYGINEDSLYSVIQNNRQYEGLLAPQGIGHRYILEDVPTGLVPFSYLGRIAEISTPTMDTIINFANTITGRNFWQEGRTLKKMGLAGMSLQDIKEYAYYGYIGKKYSFARRLLGKSQEGKISRSSVQ